MICQKNLPQEATNNETKNCDKQTNDKAKTVTNKKLEVILGVIIRFYTFGATDNSFQCKHFRN